MKQTLKDRRDEARAGHRVNEMRDARERKDKRDDAAGGRKANREERAERKESVYPAGGGYPGGSGKVEDRPLTESIGHRAREAGREMEGVGGGMESDRGVRGGPQGGTGGATGSPAPRIGKIPSGHGPD